MSGVHYTTELMSGAKSRKWLHQHSTNQPGIRNTRGPSSVGRALGSHYAKNDTRVTLFYQGKIAIIGVNKGIQMSIYPGKGALTCLLSNVVKKVGVHGCISW